MRVPRKLQFADQTLVNPLVCSLKLKFETSKCFLSSAEVLSLLQHIHQTANQVMTSWSLQAQHSFTTKTNCASLFVRFVLMILIYSYIFLYIIIYSYIIYVYCITF